MAKEKTASVELGERLRTVTHLSINDVKNASYITKNRSFSSNVCLIARAMSFVLESRDTKRAISNVRSILRTNENKQLFMKVLKLLNNEDPSATYLPNDNIVDLEEYCKNEITVKPKRKTKYLEGREDFASEVIEFLELEKEKKK